MLDAQLAGLTAWREMQKEKSKCNMVGKKVCE